MVDGSNNKLCRQVSDSGGVFRGRRWLRLPWQEKIVEIDAAKAAKKVEKGDWVTLQSSQDAAPLPVRSAEDLREAAVLQAGGSKETVVHPKLAEDLLQLDQMGATFLVNHEGRQLEVGAYGAYNALTEDLGLADLEVTLNEPAVAVKSESELTELVDFRRQRGPLVTLQQQGFQFFDSEGREISSFTASRNENSRLGVSEGWLPVNRTSVEEATDFRDKVDFLGSASAARLAAPPPQNFEELAAYVARARSPEDRVALSRYAVKDRRDEIAATINDLAQKPAEQVDALIKLALETGPDPLTVFRAAQDKLEMRPAGDLSSALLANSKRPLAQAALNLSGKPGDWRMKKWQSVFALHQAALTEDDPHDFCRAALSKVHNDDRDLLRRELFSAFFPELNQRLDELLKTRSRAMGARDVLMDEALKNPGAELTELARACLSRLPQDSNGRAFLHEFLLGRSEHPRSAFALRISRHQDGYHLKKWDSVFALYEAAAVTSLTETEFCHRVLENCHSDDRQYLGQNLTREFLPEHGHRIEGLVKALPKRSELQAAEGALYEAALRKPEANLDELVAAALERVDHNKNKDRAFLMENLLSRTPSGRGKLALRLARDGEGYHLKKWKSVIGLYQAALDPKLTATEFCRRVMDECHSDDQLFLSKELLAEFHPDSHQKLERLLAESFTDPKKRPAAVAAFYAAAAKDPEQNLETLAREAAQLVDSGNNDDRAFLFELALAAQDDELSHLALELARDKDGYRLKKWFSVFAVYEAATGPAEQFPSKVLGQVKNSEDQAFLTGEFLKKLHPDLAKELDSLVQSRTPHKAVAEVRRAALQAPEADLSGTLRAALQKFDGDNKDRAGLMEIILELESRDLAPGNAAELALKASIDGSGYHLKKWNSVFGLYNAVLNKEHPEPLVVANEALRAAEVTQDALTIGAAFMDPLLADSRTSAGARWAQGLQSKLRSPESKKAVYSAFFRLPRGAGVSQGIARVRAALAEVPSKDEQDLIAFELLNSLGDRLPRELQPKLVGALETPGEAVALLEVLELLNETHSDLDITIEEDGIQVGDTWLETEN